MEMEYLFKSRSNWKEAAILSQHIFTEGQNFDLLRVFFLWFHTDVTERNMWDQVGHQETVIITVCTVVS